MKRGTQDHPKLLALASTLKIPRAYAAGILEFMWQFTSRFAPRGDIGKYDDRSISKALDWHRAPTILISALVATGWLEESKSHRLIVHDWKDHCDQTVTKYMQRHNLEFVRTDSINVQTNDGQLPEKNSPPVPAPVPAPLPTVTPPEVRHSYSEFPLVAAAVRKYHPDTDDMFISKLVAAVWSVAGSSGDPTDAMISAAVSECYKSNQKSAGLFLRTVPQCVKTRLTQKANGSHKIFSGKIEDLIATTKPKTSFEFTMLPEDE